MAIRATRWEGVYSEGAWLLTRNLVPGVSVYGESLPRDGGVEYRRWDANRSKLAAYLKCGGVLWPFRSETSVLYLGAGSGTTASHLSDICAQGFVSAVEVSSRSFRDLLVLTERRKNLVPIFGDASKPDSYGPRVGPVDVVYQDIAQRDQGSIFLRNMRLLAPGGTGFLMVKSRSIDMAADPRQVYEAVRKELGDSGLDILDFRRLDPYEADHAVLVVRKP